MRRTLFIALVGLLGTAVLVALGTWQVQRLQWKTGVLAEIEARIGAAPVRLPQAPDPVADRFLPVRATGTFQKPELHVLVTRPGTGAAYRVIQPFATDGRVVLVDRGTVPAVDKDAPRALPTATITGNLHWPDEVDGFTPPPDTGANIWLARDLPAMAAALGADPVLIVQREPLDTPGAPRPWPIDTAGIPNNHLQYAITWFSLAAVWVAMSLHFLRRTRRPTTGA